MSEPTLVKPLVDVGEAIDRILTSFLLDVLPAGDWNISKEDQEKAKQALLELMLGVIGEDENYSSETFDWHDQELQAERNRLRAKQRAKLAPTRKVDNV